jgi:hypothetical protein
MKLLAPFEFAGRAADRLRAAMTGENRERVVFLSLVVYVVLWALYGFIAKASQGLHYDMTETIAWSRDPAWGYLKHPPAAAAAAWLWFGIFPLNEFSFYALAMTMPALALWIVWRIAGDYLPPDRRVAALALTMLVPFFNFHALKFNVNTVMIPLWAATTLFFLRSVTRRSMLHAALAGFAAALAMMGKYWSVFLLAGLIVAVLCDPRRLLYFRSPLPWITAAAGLVALSPHLYWLWQNDFAPFGYAIYIHGAKPFAATFIAALGYVAGSLAYLAVPVVLVLLAARPNRAAFADMMWPSDPDRRLAAAAFWAPFILPAFGAIASGTEITSLWSMPAWTLLTVLLLSSPHVAWRAIDTQRVTMAAIALPVVMLVASPMIAIMAQRAGPRPASSQAAILAQQVEREWYLTTPYPLLFVGGDEEIAYDVIAYAIDRPRALPNMPTPDADELRRRGMVLLCFAEDAACKAASAARAGSAPGSVTVESTVVRNFWRFPGKPQRYTITILPPAR